MIFLKLQKLSTTAIFNLVKSPKRTKKPRRWNYKSNIHFLIFIAFSGCTSDTEKKISDDFREFTPIATLADEPINIESGKLYDIYTGEKTGIHFNNKLEFSHSLWDYRNIFNGAGLAIADINNDNLPDIYFGSNIGKDQLYINKGNLKFELAPESYGIGQIDSSWTTGVTAVDINADGWLDFYVCKSFSVSDPLRRRNKFYINQKDGTFIDQAKEMGLDDDSFSMHASFLDYDNDGDLDIYVLNHPIDYNDRNKANNHEKIEAGINKSDHLYRNDGALGFKDVSSDAKINNHGFGLSVSVCDINGDNWPDIFVANDWGMQDHFYINQKDGSFSDQSLDIFSKQSFSSMGNDISDFNNDGYFDIFVSEMESKDQASHRAFVHAAPKLSDYRNLAMSNYHYQYYRNALHINNGDGTFRESARASKVSSSEWSWGTFFIDMDNDGWKDLFIANGYHTRFTRDSRAVISKIRKNYRRSEMKEVEEFVSEVEKGGFLFSNKIYKNNRDYSFSDYSSQWKNEIHSLSHGAAVSDLDLDGDLDMVTNNMNSEAYIYKNNLSSQSKTNYLRIKLIGDKANIDALGAEVKVYTRNGDIQISQVSSTRGYMSSSEFILHFGLGDNVKADSIKIKWPGGKLQILENIPANQVLEIKKSNSKDVVAAFNDAPLNKIFTKYRTTPDLFEHREDQVDDFLNNKLKPRYHSTSGPSIAVGDINGDGNDDFYISGPTNQKGQFYENRNGQFLPIGNLDIDPKVEELGVLLFDIDNDNDLDLYVTTGNIELNTGDQKLQDHIYLNDGKGLFTLSKESLPSLTVSGASVTAGDYDGDGDLDLFVGGRYIKDQYPSSPQSYLLRNDGGTFTDITSQACPALSDIGMVTSALWTDYNNDHKMDLIVIGEWMPISVFENNGKKLILRTKNLGLDHTGGWWNSIVSGDFDRDGDTDYILGNQGLNMKYAPSKDEPISIHFGEFDQEKGTDFILSYYYLGKQYPIHFLDDLAGEFDFIGKKFSSYNKYAKSTISDVLGKELFANCKTLEADIFSHTYMENTSNGFKLTPLPPEVQISNLTGMVVGDYNGDDKLDVLVQGNSFDWLPQYERQTGITGELLEGYGNGKFKVSNYVKTGFKSKEEGRALAQLKSQNTNYILSGVSNNKMNIYEHPINGSTLRLKANECSALLTYKNGQSEKIEFHIGEGYLSQSSRILSYDPTRISTIQINSYDGKQRTLHY